MAEETPQSSERPVGSEPAGNRRESVAEIRAAIAQILEEIVKHIEEAQNAAVLETERRVAVIAGERLGEAVGEFRVTVREIVAEAKRELEDRAHSKQEKPEPDAPARAGPDRISGPSVVGRVEAAARRLYTASSRPTSEAAEAAAVRAVSDAERRLAYIERRAEEAIDRMDLEMERIERGTEEARRAERRTLEAERRVRAMQRRVEDVADTAARLGEWEERMWTAIRAEEEAARRITEAEEGVLRAVKESPPAEPSSARWRTG